MIGGTDVILTSPSHFDIADIVLRLCRDKWPNCVFQDANSEDVHSVHEPWVWRFGTLSKEFFVYRDAQSASEWEECGANPESPNTMIHVLLRTSPEGSSETEVTLVCTHSDEVVNSIIESLRSVFLYAMSEQAA